jgi:hypothetical protein
MAPGTAVTCTPRVPEIAELIDTATSGPPASYDPAPRTSGSPRRGEPRLRRPLGTTVAAVEPHDERSRLRRADSRRLSSSNSVQSSSRSSSSKAG